MAADGNRYKFPSLNSWIKNSPQLFSSKGFTGDPVHRASQCPLSQLASCLCSLCTFAPVSRASVLPVRPAFGGIFGCVPLFLAVDSTDSVIHDSSFITIYLQVPEESLEGTIFLMYSQMLHVSSQIVPLTNPRPPLSSKGLETLAGDLHAV